MHDRTAIRELHVDGGPIRAIARELGISRNSVRRAVRPGSRETYYRASREERFEPAVRDVLADHPRMVVSQVGIIVEWDGSQRALARLVARLRPDALARETENLTRPRVGTLKAGTATVGTMTVGALTIGRRAGS